MLYTCKLDLKERRVPNRVWKYMILSLIPFEILEFLNYGYFEFIFGAIQFILVFALAYGLYYIGAYGGADAKALMTLSVTFPIYPSLVVSGLSIPLLNSGFGIFAFSTLSNSVVSAPALILILFIRNILKEGFRGLKGSLLYYFIGYRVSANSIPKFHNLLEYVDERGNLVRVKRGVEPDDEMIKLLKKAHKHRKVKKVWVTPGLPFLIFITAGFFISVFVGDLIYELIALFIS